MNRLALPLFIGFSILISSPLNGGSFWDYFSNDEKPPEEVKEDEIEKEETTSILEEHESPTIATTPFNKKCLRPLGIFSLADQINQSMVGIGLSQTKTAITTSDHCFPYFYAPLGLTVWMEPFLFNAKNGEGHLDFSMTTLGLKSGGEVALGEVLSLGGGVGYYHSWLKKDMDVNGIFFGPTLSASLGRGSLSMTLFWSYNHFEGREKVCDKKRRIDHHSWDQTVRIEGGWNFSLPETVLGDLSIYPFGKLDFIHVSESSYKIKSLGKVRKHNSHFFDFDLGAKVSKTLVCTRDVLILPSLLFGIYSSQATCTEKIKVSNMKVPFNPKGKVQFIFDAELAALVHKRVLIGLRYQSRSGSNAPVKGGNLRMEWSF